MRELCQLDCDESASRLGFMRVFFEFGFGSRYCFEFERVKGDLGTGCRLGASISRGLSSSSSVVDAEGLLLIYEGPSVDSSRGVSRQ